jgi:hypothetical protein
MIWGKHLNGALNVLINNVNILSEKSYNNDLLGFPNVACQAFWDSILALVIRTLRTPSECFLHIIITWFLMQFFEGLKMQKTSKEHDTVKHVSKVI